MDPDEIVVREVKRDGRLEILDPLGKGIREPSEPAHRHAHREVLALDVARADVAWIAHDLLSFGSDDVRRAVPTRALEVNLGHYPHSSVVE